MPRPSIGPRLWLDQSRDQWVIRDGVKFIRTGAGGWKKAQEMFNQYMKGRSAGFTLVSGRMSDISGFVYFMTANYPDFPVKIGFTQKRSALRAKDLQTGCPYPITVLAAFAGTYQDESALHRQFKACRLQGEWFARSDELMQLIQTHKESGQ